MNAPKGAGHPIRERGFILTEVLLTVAIIAAVLGTIAAIASQVSTESAAKREARIIETVVGDLRTIFVRRNSFQGVTLDHTLTPELDLWPTDYRASNTSVVSHWGGDITMSVTTLTNADPNTVLQFTIDGLPSDACSTLASYPFSYDKLTVGTSTEVFKSALDGGSGDAPDVTAAASACGDSSSNTVTIWFHKDIF